MSVIDRPLETIQELFEKNWKRGQAVEKVDFGVTEHFQSLFDTREKLQKIPILDAQSIHALPINSLVRFRCMVQDTELSQEVALFVTTSASQLNGEKKLVCHRYSDGPQEEHLLSTDHTQDLMDLRNSYYCVSVPGESQWVRDLEHSGSCGLDSTLQNLKLQDVKVPQVIPERYPFSGADHFAVVVKTHSSDVSIGVTDLVEVIGVLGASDQLMTGDSFGFSEEPANGPLIPTVHAILMRKLDDHGHPELGLDGRPGEGDMQHYTKEAETIRGDLIRYIATAVRGDRLAAELVLLHFLARIYSRPSGTVLGKFSLNLRDSSSNPSIYPSLARVAKSVLPKVHTVPMSLQTLNNDFFFPRGDEGLSSGVLQVTRGTAILIDETVMNEGTLVDKGLKNLKALSDVSLYQTLQYVFPFNNLEFQTDISLLIVSNGNSLVPVDCAITLRHDTSADEISTEPTEEQLVSFRKYISVLRLAEYKFSEEMAKEIETEFMEQRRAAATAGTGLITPNDLAFNISLARLVALSYGELTLTKRRWDHAVSLAKEIRSRGKQ
ncbi:MAG: putative alanine racemase-domain-containing protein [Benniella sp.]|nr:MAG: putative alanine racemase-domain-containing protein [Benniella sp.]